VVVNEITVGAVESELLLELSEVLVELSEELPEDEVVLSVLSSSESAHEETITAILTIRTNQDNKLFILSFIENVKEVRLKSHKLKLFNPIKILTKTKY
jgi:hypothetical protein